MEKKDTVGKAITSQDVAAYLGISQSTVSRAFEPTSRISEKTRARVMKAAKELGYRPNAIARSLVSQQTNLIGVIKGPNFNPMFSELLTETARAIQEQNRQMVYYEAGDSEDTGHILSKLLQYRVDGLILMYASLSSDLTREARKIGIPVLQMMRYTADSLASVVLPNNHNGAIQAIRHLRENGYQNFAYVSGEAGSSSNVERQLGFIHALGEHGQEPVISQGNYTYESGYKALYELKDKIQLPCGILCANDVMALGVLDAAKELKIRVPEEIGVVGFDDIPMSQWKSYQLTTLRQPMKQLAESAVQMLVNRIEQPETAIERVQFDFELVIRRSSSRLI